jgi:hypothetical protein
VKAIDLLLPLAGNVEAGATSIVCGDLLKDAGMPPIEVKLRNASKTGGNQERRGQKLYDTICIGIAQRLEHHHVHHGKDGSIRLNASASAVTATMLKPEFLKTIFIECLTSSLRVPTYQLLATIRLPPQSRLWDS